ncbi:MAG: ABC-F family ATP-binding cassette domain-containing protein, partial [bacterium]|nr:ABC-F family ATP-binding cassette domain-containing protein [bacterium]
IEDMSFKYDADWVLEKVNLNLYRGDKVSLVGVNGAGKTTLTRLIVEQLLPQLGSVKMGERVTVGYYAQHQVDTLNLEATAYEEIASTIATCHVPRIRDVLGVFQFRGDDVYKKIKVLSGGEKARVSLAKILLSPVNFLIMDEPTNHLDKISKDALEQALAQYNGTLLLISHDRYFLDKLVTRVFEIKDHHIREFDGNYSYYLDKRNVVPSINGQSKPAPILDKDSPSKDALSTDSSSTAQAGKKSKEQKRLEAEARQSISKEANILKKEVALTEEKIHELEAAQIDLEARLAQQETYKNSQLAVALQKEYGEVKKDLESYNERWEKAQIELDELTATIQ